jgi:uncharacterized membrane protein YtjA (UPF0391 family)
MLVHTACGPFAVRQTGRETRERSMLRWALTFFIVAIIAAFFGFGGIAGVATEFAKISFFLFLVLFVVSLVFGVVRGKPPVV